MGWGRDNVDCIQLAQEKIQWRIAEYNKKEEISRATEWLLASHSFSRTLFHVVTELRNWVWETQIGSTPN